MSDVELVVSERVAVITIQRPQARNALTVDVVLGITKALTEIGRDPEVRCVVLGGVGGHFCSGADLKKIVEDPSILDRLDKYMDDYHGLIQALVRCPKPIVARMEGAAVGFGADLALACDLRVASTTAYLQEKFVKIGLMPDGGGTFWLPRLVGTARAMRMMLLADKLEAKELFELGLVIEVTSESTVAERTMNVARQLAAGPPLAHAEIKRALYAGWGDLEGCLRREREAQLRLFKSADTFEGIMAWGAKREPAFQGK